MCVCVHVGADVSEWCVCVCVRGCVCNTRLGADVSE